MKIGISSTGNTVDSEIDIRFGRCPYFAIVEVEGKKIKKIEFIENTSAKQMGGAGITSAELVAKQDVNAVISVNMGPRAFTIFDQFKIDVYFGEGKIKEVVEKFIEGKLKKITNPNCPMNHGEK